MGIHIDTLDFFYETLRASNHVCTTLEHKWMLELGNQIIRDDAKKRYNIRTGKSKVYFLGLRCNHHSIDWNGLDGAIPIDMTKPMSIKRFINAFDIITDFGCMEHYGGNHWQAWKNIHDMGKVDCIYIHTVPDVSSFMRHGAFHFSMEFFHKLCDANNYHPLLSRVHRHDLRTDTRDYVFSSYIKTENKPFAPDATEFKEWLHR
jgi:hypothetical protein